MLKRADRKIAQPEIGEEALLPEAEERPIERLPQRIVAALDRDADPFAEKAALGIGAADKEAAIGGFGAVEPKRECKSVSEHEIHLPPLQGLTGGLCGRIGPDLSLGEQGPQIGFVCGAGDDADLLCLEMLRVRVVDPGVASCHEA